MVKYKKAKSQGPYIDRLRTQYPFRIRTRGCDAYLIGLQPLPGRQHIPVYRFPGGDSIISRSELEEAVVVEW